MDPKKNYYRTLGVPESATKKEIKTAFRNLAKQFHPDRNPGDKKSAKKFREINEAYTVLEDDSLRRKYDQLRLYGAGLDLDLTGDALGYDLNDLKDIVSEKMSGLSDFFSGWVGSATDEEVDQKLDEATASKERGKDLTYRVQISLEKAVQGGKATFSFPRGKGKDPRRIKVDLKPGVQDGDKVRLKGQGHPGKGSAGPGDLYLKFRIDPHPDFVLEGDDILVRRSLSLRDMVLGTTLEVPTPMGPSVPVEIPEGSQPNDRLELPEGAGKGRKLWLELGVELPKKLEGAAREAFLNFLTEASL